MSKYEAIYRDILGRIEQNLYAAGDTLPGEYELMKIYEASRDTIRKALLLLAQNGYIQKSKGRGSIVLDRQRYDFPVSGVVSFKELADKMEQDVQTKVICLEKTHPDARIRQLFHMSPEDEIWLVQRVRIIDHEAVILDTDILERRDSGTVIVLLYRRNPASENRLCGKGNHMPERERSGYEGSGYETV